MPRSPTGDYSLPLPPVITGEPIEATWANTTMADLGQALTDSLSRTAQGSMQEQLRLVDGSSGAPGVAFVNEAGTGMHRPAAGTLYFSVLAQDYLRLTQAGGVEVSTDGVAWETVITNGTTDTMQAQIDQNAIDISANTDSIVILSGQITDLGTLFVTTSFKSNGSIRHVLNDQGAGAAAINVSTHNRHRVNNDGALTMTFSGVPSADDPELGTDYQVEGQVVILNGASPGLITIAGLGTPTVVGQQNATTPDAGQVLTYLIQRVSGTNFTTLLWSAT